MKLSERATKNALGNGWGTIPNQDVDLTKNEIQRLSNNDPKVTKSAEPTSLIFNTRKTLKNRRGSSQKKLHAYRCGGRSGQK